MSDGWTFGRAPDPDEIQIERRPDIPFQLVGYRVEHLPCSCTEEGEPEPEQHEEQCASLSEELRAGEEVVFDFTARGAAPQGSTMRMIANADIRGNADVRSLGKWIQACLVEADRDRWWDSLDDPDVHFEAEALRDLASKLLESYGERPTQSRSARRAGVRHNGRTSTAEHAGLGSG